MEPLFGDEEIDPARPSDKLIAELELRARWLATMSEAERADLVNQPIAVVEEGFTRWREQDAAGSRDTTEAVHPS